MRVSSLRRGCRAGFPIVLFVLVMTALLTACGVGGETAKPASTKVTSKVTSPVKRNLPGATIEAGTPVAKAGTPDVQPLPSQIGDCVIEPNTDCPGADLRGAGLGFRFPGGGAGIRAELAGANLQDADLTGADLNSADFAAADLRRANLTDANLSETSLFHADLRGANLTRANLTFADMEDARLDGAILCNTTMPDGSVNSEGCP